MKVTVLQENLARGLGICFKSRFAAQYIARAGECVDRL